MACDHPPISHVRIHFQEYAKYAYILSSRVRFQFRTGRLFFSANHWTPAFEKEDHLQQTRQAIGLSHRSQKIASNHCQKPVAHHQITRHTRPLRVPPHDPVLAANQLEGSAILQCGEELLRHALACGPSPPPNDAPWPNFFLRK